MSYRTFLVAPMIICCGFGCSKQAQPGSTDSREVERVVRAAIADRFKVNPSTIDMNRPLSQPPTNADDLDVVELVMAIEERLEVTIPDEQVEELSGGKFGKSAIRLTPAQLVKLVVQANPSLKSKKR